MKARLGIALALWVTATSALIAFPSGLRAQYFRGAGWSGDPAHRTVDAEFSRLQLARRWRFRPPDAFSAQWTGYVFVNRAGLYTFTVIADDGARLFIDRQPVIESTEQGPGVRSGEMRL